MVPVIDYLAEGGYITRNMVGNIKTVNFRCGMNLVFGRIKKADSQAYWGY